MFSRTPSLPRGELLLAQAVAAALVIPITFSEFGRTAQQRLARARETLVNISRDVIFKTSPRRNLRAGCWGQRGTNQIAPCKSRLLSQGSFSSPNWIERIEEPR
ncbi:hypothetical protein EAG_05948 [Camponotus floridanus]|uniref:Uncharacterized protein n=1 Tax=Camponotus floridanus TaxID=104421 RepID=E2AY48_CAMFO|nr:hypothetical protein EAG_05948 [Camponotus floridanus]